MKEVLFHCTTEQLEGILKALKEALAARPEVVFAYAYGSFLEGRPFHDVDVGVYMATEDKGKAASLSLDLAVYLECALVRLFKGQEASLATSGQTKEYPCPRRLPVDVRVLNWAPVSFCYHVLQGRLLFSRDEKARVRWAEQVMSCYLDLKPLRDRALKEAMTSWS